MPWPKVGSLSLQRCVLANVGPYPFMFLNKEWWSRAEDRKTSEEKVASSSIHPFVVSGRCEVSAGRMNADLRQLTDARRKRCMFGGLKISFCWIYFLKLNHVVNPRNLPVGYNLYMFIPLIFEYIGDTLLLGLPHYLLCIQKCFPVRTTALHKKQ